MLVLLMAIFVPTGLAVVGLIAVLLLAAYTLAGVFGPMPRYEITCPDDLAPNDSSAFADLLQALVDAKVNRAGNLHVLANGPSFYPAELEAIRSARRSINLEAYIFRRSEIGRLYLDAMVHAARSGAQVNVLLDSFGCLGTPGKFFRPLTEAGGKVRWYNGPTWYRLLQLDNRTHRELLIVDGNLAFIGGAGIADQWYSGIGKHPRWRDTVVRVEGDAVPNLQATFTENWLVASGELLVGDAYFPPISCPHRTAALVINSTPTFGGSTRARVLSSSFCSPPRCTPSPSRRPTSSPTRASRRSSAAPSSSAT
jgi:cardiolipin synthase